jgi:hypothetical protein
MAMAMAPPPVRIGCSAVLVAVRIGTTPLEFWLIAYAVLPSGVMATAMAM